VVRDRLVAALTAAGYSPTIDASFHCMPDLGCAQVENIIAVHRGTDPTHAVLATAHYDSVPAGPGVSDDGVGTAIMLELARQRAKLPPSRNDVIFLFSDGEELGLVGAQAFAARDVAMQRIRAVVNLEARGAGGPSVMFETGTGNAGLMKLFAQSVAYPVANSLAFEIYKRLPNGTDFTVYRNRGIIGFNFAYVGDASRYHTPQDDLAHLDRDTLQHHGDHAFATVAALANANLAELKTDHDASYFDLFGRYLVQWPTPWNLPLALGGLLAIVALMLAKRRDLGAGPALWSILVALGTVVLMIGLGFALNFPLGRWPGALHLDHPMPWPGRFALLLGALLVSLLLAIFAHRRNAAAAVAYVCWLVIALLAVVVSALVPGAAYALLWPSLGFALAAWLLAWHPRGLLIASGLGVILAGFFWTGHMVMFESALGFTQSHLKMAALIPLSWALIPLLASGIAATGGPVARVVAGCTLALIVAGSAAMLTPTTSPACRSGHNVVYYDDGNAAPRWLVQTIDAPDPAYLRAVGVPAAMSSYLHLGIYPTRGPMKPATGLKIAPPTFTPISDTVIGDRRVLTGKIHLGATTIRAGFASSAGSGLLALSIEGKPVLTEELLRDGSARWFRIGGIHDRDLTIELVLAKNAQGPITLYEISTLPESAEGRAMQAARPDHTAPYGNGDSTMVVRRIKL
jgi:Peptidase family M28